MSILSSKSRKPCIYASFQGTWASQLLHAFRIHLLSTKTYGFSGAQLYTCVVLEGWTVAYTKHEVTSAQVELLQHLMRLAICLCTLELHRLVCLLVGDTGTHLTRIDSCVWMNGKKNDVILRQLHKRPSLLQSTYQPFRLPATSWLHICRTGYISSWTSEAPDENTRSQNISVDQSTASMNRWTMWYVAP